MAIWSSSTKRFKHSTKYTNTPKLFGHFFELVLCWNLISRKKDGLFYFSLSIALIFHTFSWLQVAHFYPLIMFCILSIFYITDNSVLYTKLKKAWIIPIVLTLQVYPYFYELNHSLSAEWRLFKLNMFDATTQCWARSAIYKNREILISSEDITLKVDETFISMAISNLIENALKYSEDEVIIEITNSSIKIVDKGIGLFDILS